MSLPKLKQKIIRFFHNTDGASGIEYVIIAVMIAVFIATLSGTVQTAISAAFTKITGAM